MRFASSVSTANTAERAVEELLEPVDHRLTPGMVDLALFFCTAHFEDEIPEVVERIGEFFTGALLLGCTAEGTIGFDREVERQPSMSLLAASMPEVSIRPFHIRQPDLESVRTPLDWERIVAVAPESRPVFLALADPFQVAVEDFLEQINEAFPQSPVIGGVASAARRPRQNRMIVGGEIKHDGIVGAALSGKLTVDTVVSQGCRPIGKPFVITRGERNVIFELGGKPALAQLHNVFVNLPEDDEKLARQSLLLGRVINEYKEQFTRGDFLIHNIIGVDRQHGAIGIAGYARVGATVQFHVRDAASADEDLRLMLAPFRNRGVAGAALFGCNGRGTQMWPRPGHDIGVVREILGEVPTAGFFCGGEFGPVGGRNFIHGFTASIALFREP